MFQKIALANNKFNYATELYECPFATFSFVI